MTTETRMCAWCCGTTGPEDDWSLVRCADCGAVFCEECSRLAACCKGFPVRVAPFAPPAPAPAAP